MSLNFIDLNRIGLGLVAEFASLVPVLNRKHGISQRLRGPWPKGACLWLHGASMGECKMLLNLAAALQEDIPQLPKIVLTTQKPEVLKYFRDEQFRGNSSMQKIEFAMAPADTPWTLGKFIRRVKPVGLILGENELWPGYLSAVHRYTRRPSVALVSGRFRKAVPGMDFSGLGFAAMQTFEDQNRFLKQSLKSFRAPICVGGNWKLLPWTRDMDAASAGSDGVYELAVTSFISIHIEELPALRDILGKLVTQGKSIVLAPRRLEEISQFEEVFRVQKIPVVQWPATAPGTVSIVHAFGKVPEILSRSEAAYVGGSFHKSLGIHDFWEPLQRGIPTFVGPYCAGHESAVDALVREGALVRVPKKGSWSQIPADRACVASSLTKEREKILNSYHQLKKFVEELLK